MKNRTLPLLQTLTLISVLAIALLRPSPAHALTLTVNATDDLDDGACDAAHCSLREAINAANSNPGTDIILFDALPAGSVISLTALLPPLTDNDTKIRANLHPAYAGTPVIAVDGSGLASAGPYALTDIVPIFNVQSANNTIRGLGISNNSSGPGVYIQAPAATDNVIRDNYVGTDLSGLTAAPNANGILVIEASGTTIMDNLISGNVHSGITLAGGGITGTIITGNKIGTDASGTLDLGNDWGIRLALSDPLGLGPSNNMIGTAASGNLISGNGTGIALTDASQNVIQNNLIGTDASGNTALGNGAAGIALFDASDGNQILDNTVSGNGYFAILIEGADNVVQGNKVGTDSAGSAAVGNWGGVLINSDLGGNLVGGAAAGQGNVLSGNTSAEGARIFGASSAPNTVQGNLIGTDASGTAALGNVGGVVVNAPGSGNQILDNVISGNGASGIGLIEETGAVIQGNMIGTDISGSAPLGNGSGGIGLGQDVQGTLVQGNVISGNGAVTPLSGAGITVAGTDNVIQGNFIGTDLGGTAAIPNSAAGLIVIGISSIGAGPTANNLIDGNVISGNGTSGVLISGGGNLPTGTTVQNNFIGTDGSGALAIPNGAHGVFIQAADTLVGGPNSGNVIAYNGQAGIGLWGSALTTFLTGNTFSQNSIFENGGLGIDIGFNAYGGGVNPNDPGDGDAGSNTLLNYPEFTTVNASLVEGAACDGCLVEVFLAAEDPSGYGEGMTFLADGTAVGGNFSIDISAAGLAACDKVTATATDADGNTSEFSAAVADPGLACQSTGPLIIVLGSLIPGLVLGGWVYTRTRNKPWAVGGFIGGAVASAIVFTAVGVLLGRQRTPVSPLPPSPGPAQTEPVEVYQPVTPEPLPEIPDPYEGIRGTPATLTSTPGQSVTPVVQTPTSTSTLPGVTIAPPTATFTSPPPTATSAPADTSPPKVGNIDASPNPTLTTAPVTISANVNDGSGVASVTLYYKTGKNAYTNAGAMNHTGGGHYSLTIGPLTPAGVYDFRILAVDGLGNATCTTGNLPSCPGGTFQVNIP